MSTYGYGKNSKVASLDPIMLEDELWMRQHEKPSWKREYQFFENRTVETEFAFLNFEVGSVFRKPLSEILIGFRTPLAIGLASQRSANASQVDINR